MDKLSLLSEKIFQINSEEDFNSIAISLFQLHYQSNNVYNQYIQFLYPEFQATKVSHYMQIPFLPIELFKTQQIILSPYKALDYFSSSGTTKQQKSKHYIVDFSIYEQSFLKGFSLSWGDPSEYTILALLPNYLEQKHSSLIYMIKKLMDLSGSIDNGFYLYDYPSLVNKLIALEKQGKKSILFGVSFALLDLAESYPMPLSNTYIIETGGMKGKRKELIREELHLILKQSFHCDTIYSEYGMCELFSQAYLQKDQKFVSPPWMKILIRDIHNPLCIKENGSSGAINIIDLCNLYSCPFIATQDIGKNYLDGRFEVNGRLDQSDIRGCNLMVL
ncbi:MAG: acyltransferase [Bacteroidales bacterium]